MVFFTCSHCGESVKKPSVAKHYQTKCRNNEPFLTCVDCLKDFKGNEYEAHTKCVTEDERYSAKGYVPKPSQNKGERKQQAWQECIQTVLKKPTLKPDERDLISAISKYENVPRKKAKFINFLSNAFRQYANRKDLIDRVWTEMESVFKAAASTNEENTHPDENPHKQESQNNENPTPQPDENGLKKEKKKKRKTEETPEDPEKTEEKVKKKKQKLKEEIPPEANADAVTDETESKQEKKNKKRKKSEENGLPESEQNEPVPEEAEPAKKKKKKKHAENEISETPMEIPEQETKSKKNNKKPKSESAENGVGGPEEETDGNDVKKEKKRKKSEKSESAENGVRGPEEETDGNDVKKEKKGKKSENKENCGEKMDVDGIQEKEEKATGKKKKTKGEAEAEKPETFDWKETILSVLNGKNKIPLQKLQKKVLKRHCQILNCENSQKKEKKFMKKLKEMPQIEIDNDFVVLKS